MGDNDIDLSDILALVAAVYMFIKLNLAWSQLPFPRAFPGLLTTVAELLTRYQLHNAPALHSVQQVIRVDFHILETLGLSLQRQRQRL